MRHNKYLFSITITMASLAIIYFLYPEAFTRKKKYAKIRLKNAVKIIRGVKGEPHGHPAI